MEEILRIVRYYFGESQPKKVGDLAEVVEFMQNDLPQNLNKKDWPALGWLRSVLYANGREGKAFIPILWNRFSAHTDSQKKKELNERDKRWQKEIDDIVVQPTGEQTSSTNV